MDVAIFNRQLTHKLFSYELLLIYSSFQNLAIFQVIKGYLFQTFSEVLKFIFTLHQKTPNRILYSQLSLRCVNFKHKQLKMAGKHLVLIPHSYIK